MWGELASPTAPKSACANARHAVSWGGPTRRGAPPPDPADAPPPNLSTRPAGAPPLNPRAGVLHPTRPIRVPRWGSVADWVGGCAGLSTALPDLRRAGR